VSSPGLLEAAPPRAAAPLVTVAPRRARRPAGLTAMSLGVAGLLALPLAFLLIEASGTGLHQVASLIWRPLTGELLWNTVRLTVAVTACCAVLGTGGAWLTERTDLPARRIWAVLLVVPLAIPDFVVSFGWSSLWNWAHGFRGAVLVMSLAVYPLVYLPVAASLRSADPGQEEVARSLGTSRLRVFWRITLGQARGAIVGGCLLVALVLLAEYGAFELLSYQTFTTEIFTEFNISFSVPAACALSLVLVGLSLLVLGGEGLARGRGRVTPAGSGAPRAALRVPLGRGTLPALAALAILVIAALGVPVYSSVYWMFEGGIPSVTGGAVSMLDALAHTAGYGAAAGLLDTAAALPVALLAIRHSGRARHALERSTYLVLAMPGAVIGFALAYFTEHYLDGRGYQTGLLLIGCYAIMFFPLALVGVKAAIARAPASLDEVSRSLGVGRAGTLLRVTMRLAGPGLAASFCLVFLSVVTELTATLLLIPTGVQTLATQFWQYAETDGSYVQAAPFALVMIAIAAVPSYVLGRFFDRSAGAR
jgi:iron(III) transport system permease protein